MFYRTPDRHGAIIGRAAPLADQELRSRPAAGHAMAREAARGLRAHLERAPGRQSRGDSGMAPQAGSNSPEMTRSTAREVSTPARTGAAAFSTSGSTPSYKGLTPASEAASQAKRSNRKIDTTPEVLLRRTLWRLGLRFRKNVRVLPGTPDVVFPRARVAVFCDGDFWHGRDWAPLSVKLQRGTNASYWTAKIRWNIERDKHNTKLLESSGWRVIRLWETDIRSDPVRASSVVCAALGKSVTPTQDSR
jgi:DNA mismatch endonuclease (patch repair protein)